MTLFGKRYHPPGTPPGTTQISAQEPSVVPLSVTVADYDAHNLTLHRNVALDACRPYISAKEHTWIHIEGQPTQSLINYLTDTLELHPLAVEDVINTGQRAKVDRFDDTLFVVLSYPMEREGKLQLVQFSLFLGPDFLVTVGENSGQLLEPLMRRLQDAKSRLRAHGCDYLMYLIVDLLIDQAFPTLESLGADLEELEMRILDHPDRDTIADLHFMKRELITLRRSLWPQRELINDLMREESFFKDDTRVYLRDTYDHVMQSLDMLETYRDMAASLLDIYLSSLSVKMNDIMRVLTVISTVFIPLTFISGVYGMNFDREKSPWNMPELEWTYGYPAFWGLILFTVAGLLIYFRRKRWF